jgi:hypothetical protein
MSKFCQQQILNDSLKAQSNEAQQVEKKTFDVQQKFLKCLSIKDQAIIKLHPRTSE